MASGGFSITWTDPDALLNYLPASGTPRRSRSTCSIRHRARRCIRRRGRSNCVSIPNSAMPDCSTATRGCCRDLLMQPHRRAALNGWTVRQFQDFANTLLGGAPALPGLHGRRCPFRRLRHQPVVHVPARRRVWPECASVNASSPSPDYIERRVDAGNRLKDIAGRVVRGSAGGRREQRIRESWKLATVQPLSCGLVRLINVRCRAAAPSCR